MSLRTSRVARSKASRFAICVGWCLGLLAVSWSSAAPPQPLDRRHFMPSVGPGGTALQGFGDPQNSWAWSMQWFKGTLYVGTNRSWRCFEALANIRAGLGGVYPPGDPDLTCAADPADLPLAAEIWAWTPSMNTWERMFQSPLDLPYPGRAGHWLPHDVGFRAMSVFLEPDGTEALYVSGVTAGPMVGGGLPPPRLLRSTDGLVFAPVPQDAGTAFGSLTSACLRGHASFRGKFYVTTCDLHGGGELWESADPKLGNDSFRRVSPPDLQIFEIAAFDNRLYVGTQDSVAGYSVLSTLGVEPAPFAFQMVVPLGAYLADKPNSDVLSMVEFKGRLYIGGNGLNTYTGAELIRVNPGNSWDLVVGAPRDTPQGWKYPLSGLTAGFGHSLNQHMWRMTAHENRLYVATLDASGLWKDYGPAASKLTSLYGFDLMQTGDGWYFSHVTRNGFGDRFGLGARTLASTPHGLFVGSANSHFGLQIFYGVSRPYSPTAPQRVEIDTGIGGNLVSWMPVWGAARYHVLRARLQQISLPTPTGKIQATIPEAFTELATVTSPRYVDVLSSPASGYHYLIYAESAAGTLSTTSNLVQAPPVSAPVTTTALEALVTALEQSGAAPPWSISLLLDWLLASRTAIESGNISYAIERTQQIRGLLIFTPMAGPLLKEDLEIITSKFLRRLYLAQDALIDPSALI